MYYYGQGPTLNGVGPNFNNGYIQYPNNSPGYIPGYNSGYYTGNYQVQNPYYQLQIQRQQQEAAMIEQANQQEIYNRLISHVSNYAGKKIEYNNYSQYYTKEQVLEFQRYNYESNKTANIGYNYRKHKGEKYIKPDKIKVMQNIEQQAEEDARCINKDADLFEFMQEGYKLNIGIVERERIKREQDLRQLYDQNSYRQLLMNNNIVGYQQMYDNIQPISIDDMEVSLPSHIMTNDEYKRRRNEFINQIMSKARL